MLTITKITRVSINQLNQRVQNKQSCHLPTEMWVQTNATTWICLNKYEQLVKKDHKIRTGVELASSDKLWSAILPLTHSTRFSFLRRLLWDIHFHGQLTSNKCIYWPFHYVLPVIYRSLLCIIRSRDGRNSSHSLSLRVFFTVLQVILVFCG